MSSFRVCLPALLLAVAAPCRGFEVAKLVDGRFVGIATEISLQSPKLCAEEFSQRLDHAGWHDHIYTSVQPDRAFMVFSQRVTTQGVITEVRITLWKAMASAGKTYTEQWMFKLKPGEVNDFLDSELRTLVVKFKVAPLTQG